MDRIINRLGLADDEPKVLHDRRGTTVYKINDIALKIMSGLMAAREGEILQLLGTEFYRDHGWDEERSWLTLRWIDGTGLWTELERAYRGDASATMKERMLALTAGAAQELAKLHAAGWAHGDLQPDHVIIEGESTQIIDLACAQGPADVPFYVHRGGLAHTTAPEIADLILSSEEHIMLTSQADIWSLGASLWWAWTRTTPITYTDPAAGRTAQLKDIAAVRRPDPSTARPWPFKEFEEAVMGCLATDPDDRPTAEQLATTLRWPAGTSRSRQPSQFSTAGCPSSTWGDHEVIGVGQVEPPPWIVGPVQRDQPGAVVDPHRVGNEFVPRYRQKC